MAESPFSTTSSSPLSADACGGTEQVPQRRVSFLFQLTLGLANMAVWLALVPAISLLLPLQLAIIDPLHKATTLSFMTFAGGLVALVAQPLAGALSDRTTLRLGRRRPWVVGGLLVSISAIFLLAQARSIFQLLVGWTLFSFAINVTLSCVLASIPDMVPSRQRATVSAFVGLAQPLGTLIGVILIAQIIKDVQASYVTVAIICCVCVALFVLSFRERPVQDVPRFSLRHFLAGIWVNPLKYPDFGYVWLGRFFIILSGALPLIFLLFFLQDDLHYDRLFPGQTAAQGVAIFQVIYTGATIISSILGGILSDRTQRRKLFVIGASLVQAGALLLLTLFPLWSVVLTVAAIFGFGFGCYLSADIALATQVLPNAEHQGGHLGLITVANTIPQLLLPVVVGIALGLFHSYVALFAIAACSALLGAVCIIPVKGVR